MCKKKHLKFVHFNEKKVVTNKKTYDIIILQRNAQIPLILFTSINSDIKPKTENSSLK